MTAADPLTTIVVVGVVVALLLPALQSAREAARRSQCQNSLKNISIALLNHEVTHQSFPPAYEREKGDTAEDRRGWGWGTMLLPYLDQAALSARLNEEETPFPATGTKWTTQLLEVFRCPSNPGPDANPNFGNHGTSNYAAVWGKGTAGPQNNDCSEEIKAGNGMFSANSQVRIRDVFDGTVNTLSIGERRFGRQGPERRFYAGAVWPGMPAPGKYHATMAAVHRDRSRTVNGTAPTAFSSYHPGGTQFAFVDGSVRFLSENIDGRLYERLGDRNDGGAVELP